MKNKLKMKKLLYILFVLLTLQSCSSGGYDDEYSEEYDIEGQKADGFEDGTYCAEVEYYNPNTGTNSTYTLEVEVESNEVTTIYWSNGGWLDEDHFYPEELDSDGTCSFTSDKGYDYTVTIIGQDCGSTDQSSFESDVQEDEEALTCPNCGGEKEDYEDVCYSCQLDEESY
jgi:hypothetical protein